MAVQPEDVESIDTVDNIQNNEVPEQDDPKTSIDEEGDNTLTEEEQFSKEIDVAIATLNQLYSNETDEDGKINLSPDINAISSIIFKLAGLTNSAEIMSTILRDMEDKTVLNFSIRKELIQLDKDIKGLEVRYIRINKIDVFNFIVTYDEDVKVEFAVIVKDNKISFASPADQDYDNGKLAILQNNAVEALKASYDKLYPNKEEGNEDE